MTRSKVARFAVAYEAFVVALVASNPLPLPPPKGITNPGATTPLHPYLVQASQIAIFVQVTSFNPYVPPLVLQPEALSGLQVLQANLGVHGANELLNNIYNIA